MVQNWIICRTEGPAWPRKDLTTIYPLQSHMAL